MSDYNFGDTFVVMFWLLAFSVPLGLWKLVEIIIWLWNHIEIGIK